VVSSSQTKGHWLIWPVHPLHQEAVQEILTPLSMG
jgi:hypothetical protein